MQGMFAGNMERFIYKRFPEDNLGKSTKYIIAKAQKV